MARRGAWFATLMIVCNGGCTTFAPVRSAEVAPGYSHDMGITLASAPGEEAAWFWSLECEVECDHAILSYGMSSSYGVVSDEGRAYELGAGLAGTYPYLHGFVQVRRGARPFGIGARIGLSVKGWREDALLAAYDIILGPADRLLFTSTVFRHGGNSPNGENPGSFLAFAQAIGLRHGTGRRRLTPSLGLAVGRVRRSSYGRRISAVTGLIVVGLSMTVLPR